MTKKILLVCTGNTCRSVMGQGIMEELAIEMGFNRNEVKVLSAGIAAYPGAPATREAVMVLKEMGIDMSRHLSRPLTSDLVDNSDIILTMTANHARAVLKMFPASKDKVYSLGEYIGDNQDLDDPIGMPLDVYRELAKRLEKKMIKAINHLFAEE